jgi:hypothetical protein
MMYGSMGFLRSPETAIWLYSWNPCSSESRPSWWSHSFIATKQRALCHVCSTAYHILHCIRKYCMTCAWRHDQNSVHDSSASSIHEWCHIDINLRKHYVVYVHIALEPRTDGDYPVPNAQRMSMRSQEAWWTTLAGTISTLRTKKWIAISWVSNGCRWTPNGIRWGLECCYSWSCTRTRWISRTGLVPVYEEAPMQSLHCCTTLK